MAQHTDVKTARIAAEAAVRSNPTPANHSQLSRTNELEVAIAQLKIISGRIQAAGGLSDSAANTALTNLVANL